MIQATKQIKPPQDNCNPNPCVAGTWKGSYIHTEKSYEIVSFSQYGKNTLLKQKQSFLTNG